MHEAEFCRRVFSHAVFKAHITWYRYLEKKTADHQVLIMQCRSNVQGVSGGRDRRGLCLRESSSEESGRGFRLEGRAHAGLGRGEEAHPGRRASVRRFRNSTGVWTFVERQV